jgi:hypothetical protein
MTVEEFERDVFAVVDQSDICDVPNRYLSSPMSFSQFITEIEKYYKQR